MFERGGISFVYRDNFPLASAAALVESFSRTVRSLVYSLRNPEANKPFSAAKIFHHIELVSLYPPLVRHRIYAIVALRDQFRITQEPASRLRTQWYGTRQFLEKFTPARHPLWPHISSEVIDSAQANSLMREVRKPVDLVTAYSRATAISGVDLSELNENLRCCVDLFANCRGGVPAFVRLEKLQQRFKQKNGR